MMLPNHSRKDHHHHHVILDCLPLAVLVILLFNLVYLYWYKVASPPSTESVQLPSPPVQQISPPIQQISPPIQQISVLGERNSGTRWMYE